MTTRTTRSSSGRRRSSSRTRAGSAEGRRSSSSRREHQPQMDFLHEEAQHAFLVESEHEHFVTDKMDALRVLILDIQQDDWKYAPPEKVPAHVTHSLAWKQPSF